MSDIEIARAATAQPICDIAEKVGIPGDAVMPYGNTKAKIDPGYIESLQGRPDGMTASPGIPILSAISQMGCAVAARAISMSLIGITSGWHSSC